MIDFPTSPSGLMLSDPYFFFSFIFSKKFVLHPSSIIVASWTNE